MKKNLKILSIIGLALIVIAIFGNSNPTQYLIEMVGMLALAGYAWNYFNDRIVMLWVAGFFGLVYLFINLAVVDFLFWLLAFVFLYKDVEPKKLEK